MIEQLFGSKTRVKLLNLFYSNPNRPFYVREITRKVEEQINSVRRELSNLLSVGVITSDSVNNKLYYEVNQSYDHYSALSAIFGAGQNRTVTQANSLSDQEKRFREIGSVKVAYLMGKYVRDNRIGVDVFIVGDVNRTKLNHLIEELEAEEGHELNFSLMSEEEYIYRRDLNDRFVSDIVAAKRTKIIDELIEVEDQNPKAEELATTKSKTSGD